MSTTTAPSRSVRSPWRPASRLDNGLIRRANGNLGRQALVVGMRHFARTAGCRLIAEGIETEAEARTLIQLGVEFGQGYWYGRPEPAPDGD